MKEVHIEVLVVDHIDQVIEQLGVERELNQVEDISKQIDRLLADMTCGG